jgi:CubicO group peptidase (beta-lactamase class C family)
MGDRSAALPRRAPESLGIPSGAIEEFLREAEGVDSLHGFMLLRGGCVAAEGWLSPCRPELPRMLYSLSKSFTSTAVGFAVQEGLLSLDDPVISFFPGDLPKRPDSRIERMKVRHLLTMTTGHAADATEATLLTRGGRAAKAFLSLPLTHDPGTHFVYNSAASFMLAKIIRGRTGLNLREYLMPRLFAPLGIEEPEWDRYRDGTDFGGWGLNLRLEDIARFGQFLLNEGSWEGNQLLDPAWIREATSKRVDNSGTNRNPDWTCGYGYQFWRCSREGVYRGDGAFGQFCVVMPEQGAVLAAVSGTNDMGKILECLWRTIFPAFRRDAIALDPGAERSQAAMVSRSSLSPVPGKPGSPFSLAVSGKKIVVEENAALLAWMRLDLEHGVLELKLNKGRRGPVPIAGGIRRIPFGLGVWVEGNSDIVLTDRGSRPVAASGAWTAPDTFTVKVFCIVSPHILTIALRFAESRVESAFSLNVNMGPAGPLKFAGKVEE